MFTLFRYDSAQCVCGCIDSIQSHRQPVFPFSDTIMADIDCSVSLSDSSSESESSASCGDHIVVDGTPATAFTQTAVTQSTSAAPAAPAPMTSAPMTPATHWWKF